MHWYLTVIGRGRWERGCLEEGDFGRFCRRIRRMMREDREREESWDGMRWECLNE